jgi:hypothetical protein
MKTSFLNDIYLHSWRYAPFRKFEEWGVIVWLDWVVVGSEEVEVSVAKRAAQARLNRSKRWVTTSLLINGSIPCITISAAAVLDGDTLRAKRKQ